MRLGSETVSKGVNQAGEAHSTGADLRLSETIAHFIQHARLEGRSRNTMELYDYVFQTLHQSVGDPRLDDIDAATMKAHFASLMDRDLKASTVETHHRFIKALFNWAVAEVLIEENPLDRVPKPKVPKVFPFMLDDDQVAALIKACDTRTRHGHRNYTILLLFLDCGLRLNELTALRLDDVSLTRRSLKIHGKGAKKRIVFMGAGVTKALRRWIKMRPSQKALTDHVFIDRTGEPLKGRWVQQVIVRIGQRAGIEKRVSPHKLRHVSATMAVQNGMDAFSLQRLYGWESVQTAMRYVNAANPALREAHAKSSPVDRLES